MYNSKDELLLPHIIHMALYIITNGMRTDSDKIIRQSHHLHSRLTWESDQSSFSERVRFTLSYSLKEFLNVQCVLVVSPWQRDAGPGQLLCCALLSAGLSVGTDIRVVVSVSRGQGVSCAVIPVWVWWGLGVSPCHPRPEIRLRIGTRWRVRVGIPTGSRWLVRAGVGVCHRLPVVMVWGRQEEIWTVRLSTKVPSHLHGEGDIRGRRPLDGRGGVGGGIVHP